MSETLNDWFNSFIEVSSVALARLVDLPIIFLTALLLAGVTAAWLVYRLVRRLRGRPEQSWRPYRIAVVAVFAVSAVVLLDQKLVRLQKDIGKLEYEVRGLAVSRAAHGEATPETKSRPAAETAKPAAAEAALKRPRGPHRLFDPDAVEKGLESIFPERETKFSVVNRAVEFVSIHSSGRRPVATYLAVIDLTDPGIRLKITDAITEKTLTSAFGQAHGCAVAINGEAGTSPALTAPLGRYTGFCVSKGKVVLDENPYGRPFIWFDKNNKAHYVREDAEIPKPTAEMYNVKWGRGDFLLDGKYERERSWRWAFRDPRTIMAIDEEGTRLILMVVDGRQRGYSEGMGLRVAAAILKVFGAHFAMRCDQGGSSAMYLGTIGGIVSRPSDGKERPTYTHFGVSFATK